MKSFTVGGGPGTQGPNFPSTGQDVGYGDFNWTNPEYITSDDGLYASSTIVFFGGITTYLNATNFGFSIPTSATIDGIEVKFKGYTDNGAIVADWRLFKGEYPTGTDFGGTGGQELTNSDTIITWGNPNFTPSPLTPSDVNASDFSVLLQFYSTILKSPSTVYVNYVTVKIYYTT